MRRRTAVAVTASSLLAVGFLAWLLAQPGSSRVATNTEVVNSRYLVTVFSGQTYCQGGEYVPATADTVRMLAFPVGTAMTPPMPIRFGAAHGRLDYRARAAPQPPGKIRARLPPHSDVELGRFCITNPGPGQVQFAGNLTPLNPEGVAGKVNPGKRGGDQIRLDYFSNDDRSWFADAGPVAHRWQLFTPWGMGAAWLWVILGFAVALCALALGIYVRWSDEHA